MNIIGELQELSETEENVLIPHREGMNMLDG